MSEADTAAPIGCPKTDTHEGGKFTSAAIASKGEVARERTRAMSAWRANGRVSTIVASTIALDEIWTYLGARKEEKRNALWVWTAVVEERDGSR